MRSLHREFRNFDPDSVRVVLVDAGREPLPTFGDNLAEHARRELEDLGVELHMGGRVTKIDGTGVDVTTADGATEHFDSHVVVWAAGVQASPLAGKLATAAGAETDRIGRIKVQPDLTLPGHPEVFAVGDMAALDDLPGVAEVAMQGSLHAANTIRHRLLGDDEARRFKYRDLGSVAVVGTLPRDLQLAPHPALGLPGVDRVGVRAPRVPQQLCEPVQRALPLDPVDARARASGTRDQRGARWRRPQRGREPVRRDRARRRRSAARAGPNQ